MFFFPTLYPSTVFFALPRYLVDSLVLLGLLLGIGVVEELALLPGNDDVLEARPTLPRRTVDPAGGVDYVGHQVPVGNVRGRDHDQVQRQFLQSLHGLETEEEEKTC